MPISLIALLAAGAFLAAYFVYGRKLATLFSLKENNVTPAEKFNDGYDFIPTKKPILLAQHFASIAAAGPIVGPIAAGLAFGWGPTLLWIILGCIFIGACHDLASLVASVKHDARSIPQLAKELLGVPGYRLVLTFIWLCLIYVIIAFTDVTAQQFVAREEWNGQVHDIGGGVAMSSFLYLGLSILLGIALEKFKVPLWLATVLFFPALVALVIFGQSYPILFPVADPVLVWGLVILAYCAVASIMPMWLLLQPRGYLGGFFLYAILAIGVAGLGFGGFDVEYPMVKGFFSPKGESIYPFLFITVACGACSGFHGLVCSGTTSKQLHKETHAPLVGYGGMLLEGVVAVMALSTVMIWGSDNAVLQKSPSEIYATGIAHFAHSVFGLDITWGITFGMLAFATFVYDTLDVATRLSRFLIEELFNLKGFMGHVIATAATLAIPLLYVVSSPAVSTGVKRVPLWSSIWPLFGSSNQLLAALTLLLMSLWMEKKGKRAWWLLIPAAFMFLTSSLALVLQASQAFGQLRSGISGLALVNLIICLALLVLAVRFGGFVIRTRRTKSTA